MYCVKRLMAISGIESSCSHSNSSEEETNDHKAVTEKKSNGVADSPRIPKKKIKSRTHAILGSLSYLLGDLIHNVSDGFA